MREESVIVVGSEKMSETLPLIDTRINLKTCAFPKCRKKGVTTYCGIRLCMKHIEWAEFIRWFYYKLGL